MKKVMRKRRGKSDKQIMAEMFAPQTEITLNRAQGVAIYRMLNLLKAEPYFEYREGIPPEKMEKYYQARLLTLSLCFELWRQLKCMGYEIPKYIISEWEFIEKAVKEDEAKARAGNEHHID